MQRLFPFIKTDSEVRRELQQQQLTPEQAAAREALHRQFAVERRAMLTQTPLTTFAPDGPPVVPPSPKFTKDTVNGWIIGHHPLGTPAGHEKLQAALLQHQQVFVYSLEDLTGYCGHMGPMHIKLKPNVDVEKMFSKPRRYSPHEIDITN